MSRMVLIGGGELKTHETLKIDEYIVGLAQKRSGERRVNGLFLPTASHDCMPYYNTFHKVYTGHFGIKTDVALTVGRAFDPVKMREKFERADLLYIGGGNTVFMLGEWERSGLLVLIREAYERDVVIAGLSAGAICWFEEMYSDSVAEGEYAMYPGLGWLKGTVSPHYNERADDFDRILLKRRGRAFGIENNAALLIEDGRPRGSVSGGGNVYRLDASDGDKVVKTVFEAPL